MIPFVLGSIALFQAPDEVKVGERTIGGQVVAFGFRTPLVVGPPDQSRIKVGRDWVIPTPDGNWRSLRSSEPTNWMLQAGVQNPNPDAAVFRVAFRVFLRREAAAVGFEGENVVPGNAQNFDDQELSQIREGLAATEAYWETVSGGEIDFQTTLLLDPVPLPSASPLPLMAAMTREDNWENAEGKVTPPFHVSVAIVPGTAEAKFEGARSPYGVVYWTAGSTDQFVQTVSLALSKGLGVRATQNGYLRAKAGTIFGDYPSLWAAVLQTGEAPGEDFIARRTTTMPAVLQTLMAQPLQAISQAEGDGFPGIRFLDDNTVLLDSALVPDVLNQLSTLGYSLAEFRNGTWPPSVLLRKQGTPAARYPELSPSVFVTPEGDLSRTGPFVVGRIGTLGSEANGTNALRIKHSGSTPWGQLPILRVPFAATTKVYRIEFLCKNKLKFPVELVAGAQPVVLNLARGLSAVPVCNPVLVESEEPQRVSVDISVAPRTGTIDLRPVRMPDGFDGSPVAGQSLEVEWVSMTPIESANVTTTSWVAPPVPDERVELEKWLAEGSIEQRIWAMRKVQSSSIQLAPEKLAELARSVDRSVSWMALELLRQSNPAASEAALKYALEVGPFEHNREIAAQILAKEPNDKLARSLGTLVLASHWPTRVAASHALGKTPSSEANVALLLLLTDPEPAVRLAAANNIRLEGELPHRRLLYAAVNDPSELVRIAAYQKLLDSTMGDYFTQAQKGVRDESARVRAGVLTKMQAQGKESHLEVIKLALGDKSPQVRAAAVRALTTQPKTLTKEELGGIVDDVHPWVQAALQLLRDAGKFPGSRR